MSSTKGPEVHRVSGCTSVETINESVSSCRKVADLRGIAERFVVYFLLSITAAQHSAESALP